MVLEQGIVEGRKTYANMIKYIKMTASSNFGNMLSVLAASALLPFLPMMSVHLIFLNLIYDLSCTAIPWDNVDEEFIAKPRKWDASSDGAGNQLEKSLCPSLWQAALRRCDDEPERKHDIRNSY